jgi:hypothetical protein
LDSSSSSFICVRGCASAAAAATATSYVQAATRLEDGCGANDWSAVLCARHRRDFMDQTAVRCCRRWIEEM